MSEEWIDDDLATGICKALVPGWNSSPDEARRLIRLGQHASDAAALAILAKVSADPATANRNVATLIALNLLADCRGDFTIELSPANAAQSANS